MSTIKIKSLEQIEEAAIKFVNQMNNNTVFAFYGEMGAGKTTFIKEICKVLGVSDTITSPTFAIINEYKAKKDKKIYHFDFYRINKIEEAFDFGYEDYFYSDSVCFIEWPERVESLLPPNCVNVTVTVNQDDSRSIYIENN